MVIIVGTLADVPVGGKFWLCTGPARDYRAMDLARAQYVRSGLEEYSDADGVPRRIVRPESVDVYLEQFAPVRGTGLLAGL